MNPVRQQALLEGITEALRSLRRAADCLIDDQMTAGVRPRLRVDAQERGLDHLDNAILALTCAFLPEHQHAHWKRDMYERLVHFADNDTLDAAAEAKRWVEELLMRQSAIDELAELGRDCS